jgi:hypothetical protein
MNEFETKLDELKMNVEIGRIKIIDPLTGLPVVSENLSSYVKDNYFESRTGVVDLDNGIEGVE